MEPKQRRDLIIAIGYISCDIAREDNTENIQESWRRLLDAIGEKNQPLTADELEILLELSS